MDLVYVVLSEGEAMFASRIEEIAEAYAENENDKRINQVCNEREEELNVENVVRSAYLAGFDEEWATSYKINLSKYTEGDTVEFPDGSEIAFEDIITLIEESKNIYSPDQLTDYMDDDGCECDEYGNELDGFDDDLMYVF